jgi:hypothetical protein
VEVTGRDERAVLYQQSGQCIPHILNRPKLHMHACTAGAGTLLHPRQQYRLLLCFRPFDIVELDARRLLGVTRPGPVLLAWLPTIGAAPRICASTAPQALPKACQELRYTVVIAANLLQQLH